MTGRTAAVPSRLRASADYGRGVLALYLVVFFAGGIAMYWVATTTVPALWVVVVYALLAPFPLRATFEGVAALQLPLVRRSLAVRRALANDEIELFYQPKADAFSGEVVAVEALARWRQPSGAVVPPATWIDGTQARWISPYFNRYVLRRAVAQAARWHAAERPVMVCANVPPSALCDSGFAATVADEVAAADLPPHLLMIEVTEQALELGPAAVAAIQQTHDLGVGIAIDDFGTGQSGLARLASLDIDELKIDRSFVLQMSSDRRARVIVDATIAMAHNLGLTVIAEGVEDEQTWRQLRDDGCDQVQGYLMTPALPAAELEAWLDERGTNVLG